MIHAITQDWCRLKTRLSLLNLYSSPKTCTCNSFMKDFVLTVTCLNFRLVRRKEVIVYMDSKVTKFMGMRGLDSFKNEAKGKSYSK